MSYYTAFTKNEALNAVDTIDGAMDDPAVFRALLATPGLVPKVAAAVAVLDDYVANARLSAVARDVARVRRWAPSTWRDRFQEALGKSES